MRFGFEEVTGEFEQKLPAYENDKLFMYLIERQYEKESYRSNALTRRLDGWVAEIVQFKDAKKNYDFLRSMPELMQIEVERRERELKEESEKVHRMHREVADKHGLTKVLEEGNQLGERRKKAIDRLDMIATSISELNAELSQMENTQGEYHREAVKKIQQFLESQSIEYLRSHAQKTITKRDDQLVLGIEALDEEIAEKTRMRDSFERSYTQLTTKLKELQRLQSTYTAKDYDSRRSSFPSHFDIEDLLLAFLSGRYDYHQAWKVLDTSQRFEQRRASTFRTSSGSGLWGWPRWRRIFRRLRRRWIFKWRWVRRRRRVFKRRWVLEK